MAFLPGPFTIDLDLMSLFNSQFSDEDLLDLGFSAHEVIEMKSDPEMRYKKVKDRRDEIRRERFRERLKRSNATYFSTPWIKTI